MLLLLLSCTVPTTSDPVVLLRIGDDFTYALLSSGKLLVWGWEGIDASTLMVPEGEYVDVDVDYKWSCAVTRDGEIRCWGENQFEHEPPPSGSDFQKVILYNFQGCGLHRDGTLSCWNNRAPQKLPPADTKFTQVSGGSIISCGIKTDATILCWGLSGVMPPPPAGRFQSVDVSTNHACAVSERGHAQCWGYNAYGQNNVPDATFKQLKTGWDHACGLTSSDEILCWGMNEYGESQPPPGKWSQLDASPTFACALNKAGKVKCWGDESYSGTVPESIAAD